MSASKATWENMGHVAIGLFMILIISLVFTFSSLEIANCIPANGSINVPYSTNTPNIDGQWSNTTEWNDASENKITNEFGWTSYLRLKHNETHVFALLDFVSDQSDSLEDFATFAIDTNNDGGNVVKPDDYKFSFYHRLYFAFYKGEVAQGTGFTPSSWVGISEPSGFIMQRGFSKMGDPYELQEAHSLFEAAIPYSLLSLNNNIGFYAYANDSISGVALEFPVGTSGNSPGNWGNIVLERGVVSPSPLPTQSNNPEPSNSPSTSPSPTPTIPEFPSTSLCTIFIITATLLGTVLIKRKQSRRRTL